MPTNLGFFLLDGLVRGIQRSHISLSVENLTVTDLGEACREKIMTSLCTSKRFVGELYS